MIPLIRPSVPAPEKWMEYYTRSIRAGHYSNFGPVHEMLTKRLAWYTGRPTLPVTNGTSAITVALLATCRPKTRVALPAFTVPATLQAVLSAGMIPVIFPCDPGTWTINMQKLRAWDHLYDAFIVVSPFGYAVQTDAYDKIAASFGKTVVYDFAGGWGQFPDTRFPVTYSFHATKNFSIGEGGCVSFASPEEFSRAKSIVNFGYEGARNVRISYCQNAKLDELRSAVALSVLDSHADLLQRIENKRRLYGRYLKAIDFTEIEAAPDDMATHGFPSLCVFRIPGMAKKIEESSQQLGFVTRRYYEPLVNRMDVAGSMVSLPEGKDSFFADMCALPSAPTDPEFDKIVRGLKSICLGDNDAQRQLTDEKRME